MSRREKRAVAPFTRGVVRVIRSIPRGRVATYGQIAELAGRAGAARGVSWILHSSAAAAALPWHRVIGAKGKIAFDQGSRHFRAQVRLLRGEGVTVAAGLVDLAEFGWTRRIAKARSKRTPRLFS